MNTRLPWDKWEYAAWLRDPNLRQCSPAARAVWMDMLCVMDACNERGYLLIAGRAPTPGEIAKATGNDKRLVVRVLVELETHAVFSRDERGAPYCRRMVRSWNKLQRDQANGRQGGNPNLKQDGSNLQQGGSNLQQPGNGLPPAGVSTLNDYNNMTDKPLNPEKRREEKNKKGLSNESPSAAPGTGPATASPGAADPVVSSGPVEESVMDAVAAWNEMAGRCGLARVQAMSRPRRQSLALRLRDVGGLAGWRSALDKVANTPFLLGENDRQWRADFDWIVKPASFTRLVEGAYDRSRRPARATGGSTGHDWMAKPNQPDLDQSPIIDGFAEI